MSRAMELDSVHQLLKRARARLFPPSKWAGLFPSAAYRRSAPPQVARGGLNQCKLQCRGIAWMVLQSRRTGLFFFCGWRYPYANNVAWDTSIIGFLQRKRPAGFHIHAGLFCEPRGLSPSGGKTPANLLFLEQLRAL